MPSLDPGRDACSTSNSATFRVTLHWPKCYDKWLSLFVGMANSLGSVRVCEKLSLWALAKRKSSICSERWENISYFVNSCSFVTFSPTAGRFHHDVCHLRWYSHFMSLVQGVFFNLFVIIGGVHHSFPLTGSFRSFLFSERRGSSHLLALQAELRHFQEQIGRLPALSEPGEKIFVRFHHVDSCVSSISI